MIIYIYNKFKHTKRKFRGARVTRKGIVRGIRQGQNSIRKQWFRS